MLTLYKTKQCAYCPMVAKFLTLKGVTFQEVYVDDDAATRKELLEKTGLMTVPVTTNGEQYVVGWNPAKLSSLIA